MPLLQQLATGILWHRRANDSGRNEEFFPKIKVFEIDSDSVSNDKEGKKMADDFLLGGGIVVGTEMIFSYIKQPIDHIVAMSIDGLFAMPEFKMNEKIFRLLLTA